MEQRLNYNKKVDDVTLIYSLLKGDGDKKPLQIRRAPSHSLSKE